MARTFKQKLRRVLGLLFLLLLGCTLLLAAVVIWQPRAIFRYAGKSLSPKNPFDAGAVEWTSTHSLLIQDFKLGDFMKIPSLTVTWDWNDLMARQRIKEVRLTHAKLQINLSSMGLPTAATENSTSKASLSPPWYLDRLVVERSALVMVGLGPEVPPLALELEGEWKDIPISGQLSQKDLDLKRSITLHQVAIHSPLDLTSTILKIEKATFDFHYGGLRQRNLDSITFMRPVLVVDRSLFWFIDTLRQARAGVPAQKKQGAPWTVSEFNIRKGHLDITRFEALYAEYPFEFEASRKDLRLDELSLADLKIDLVIPPQNLFWPSIEMFFTNLRGKISFNLGEATPAADSSSKIKKANDLVNTLHADSIEWKKMKVKEPWMSMVFDAHSINGTLGGAFADGYINGGTTFGWASADDWYLWGSASDINTSLISETFNNENYGMTGRAGLKFNVKGSNKKLLADVNLSSLTPGIIEIRSLDKALDRIEKNTSGVKREVMKTFISNLRNYPYQNYLLDIHFDTPDALLQFRADGDLGSRKLDLRWHGLQNTTDKKDDL